MAPEKAKPKEDWDCNCSLCPVPQNKRALFPTIVGDLSRKLKTQFRKAKNEAACGCLVH